MDLDKRIKKGKRPLTCFDTKRAKAFLNKECYFSNTYCAFEDLNRVPKAVLQYISDDKDASDPYKTACYFYPFCLPCEWVEEPEFRPYTDEEFLTLFDLGKFHSIRIVDKPYTRVVITGTYSKGGILYISLSNNESGYGVLWLFKHCEYFNGEEWKPFGIKE